jgi:hypothetical protein
LTILRLGDPAPKGTDCVLCSRSGWPIPCEEPNLLPIEILKIHAQELMKWRANLTLRSISPYPYNCVGMIFAARRAWIEIDHIYRLLAEDGYRKIELERIMVGDLVLYIDNLKRTPTHVGIIVTIDYSIGRTIKVMSKWGRDPEFIHLIENVPEFFGSPSEYWTDRHDID